MLLADRKAARVLASAWWAVFRNQRVTARHAILTALEGIGEEAAQLRAALAPLAPSPYPNSLSPHRLGRWLARAADQIITIDSETAFAFTPREPASGSQGQVWQLLPAQPDLALLAAEAALPELVDAVA